MQHHRGFTLLEIILVVALAAVTFTLVPRLFGSGVSGAEIKSNVRTVAAAMKLARDAAINTRRDAFVTVNVESRELTASFDNKVHQLNNQLTLKLFTSQADQINEATASFRFYPDGSSNGGRITIIANEREFAIDVDWLTGRATVTDSVLLKTSAVPSFRRRPESSPSFNQQVTLDWIPAYAGMTKFVALNISKVQSGRVS